MRETKFRGKRADTDWKYGYLTIIEKPQGTDNLIAIKPFDEQWITYGVDPDSVGEYTGLKDLNGVEIYEGDVVIFKDYDHPIVAEVVWNGAGQWDYRPKDWIVGYHAAMLGHSPGVIGNIYENPSLLSPKADVKLPPTES